MNYYLITRFSSNFSFSASVSTYSGLARVFFLSTFKVDCLESYWPWNKISCKFLLTILSEPYTKAFLPPATEFSTLSSVLSVGTLELLPAIYSTRLCLISVFCYSLASRRSLSSCSRFIRASSFCYRFVASRSSRSNALRRAFSLSSASNLMCLISRQGPHSQIFPDGTGTSQASVG
jgi:hypothetical protein